MVPPRTCSKSLFIIFSPTPFCHILAAKPSDLLGVGTAMPRRSSGFSLKISLKWLWEKDDEQALSPIKNDSPFYTVSITVQYDNHAMGVSRAFYYNRYYSGQCPLAYSCYSKHPIVSFNAGAGSGGSSAFKYGVGA